MAAQPFVVQGDGHMVAQTRLDVFHPRSCQLGLGSFVAGGIDRQPDDELGDVVRDDEREERVGVQVDMPAAAECRQWPRPDVGPVGDRDPDAPLPEIDAEGSRHGDASGWPLGVSSPGASAPPVSISTRESIVGTVPTQSGQTVSWASPYLLRISRACASGLPMISASIAAGSSCRTWRAVTTTGKVMTPPEISAGAGTTCPEPGISS